MIYESECEGAVSAKFGGTLNVKGDKPGVAEVDWATKEKALRMPGFLQALVCDGPKEGHHLQSWILLE